MGLTLGILEGRPNYLVTFVASSLTIGFDAFIVDLMSQSRDFAPMGDDEAGERRWGQWRGEVLSPSGEQALSPARPLWPASAAPLPRPR